MTGNFYYPTVIIRTPYYRLYIKKNPLAEIPNFNLILNSHTIHTIKKKAAQKEQPKDEFCSSVGT